MSKMNELDVVKQEQQLAVSSGMDELMEELDGVELSFDKIKIPSGGVTAFEVPGDDPENPDMVKELVGVVVHHQPKNVYYRKSFEERGPEDSNAPDCSSRDGKTGVRENGTASCKTCKYNKWGSGKNGGKACQNRMDLYVLMDGAFFPVVLSLPGTSIKAFNAYVQGIVIRNKKKVCAVKTKITLKKVQNSTGINYATCVFSKVGDLEEGSEELMQALSMRETCRAYALSDRAEESEEADGDGELTILDDADDSGLPF